MGALFVGHDRLAQAHRARPGRNFARAHQGLVAAPGPHARGPFFLVHQHWLDDVELYNTYDTETEEIILDDFNDGVADGWTEHLGTWSVISGEYFISVGIVENGISTVSGLNLTDCKVETKLRFNPAVNFRAGIVFRYTDNEHYYSFELSDEYDCAAVTNFLEGSSTDGCVEGDNPKSNLAAATCGPGAPLSGIYRSGTPAARLFAAGTLTLEAPRSLSH